MPVHSFSLSPQTVEWLRRLPRLKRSAVVNALLERAIQQQVKVSPYGEPIFPTHPLYSDLEPRDADAHCPTCGVYAKGYTHDHRPILTLIDTLPEESA